jgi:hypothetical protein
MTMPKQQWAINLGDGRLAGVFFWLQGPTDPWNDGMRTAIFGSRKIARASLRKGMKQVYPKSHVVKVRVTVEMI